MRFRLIGLFVLAVGVAFGQAETPDIGQLKTKLQRLEQMMQEVGHVGVNVEQVAQMGATLANGGVNPGCHR